MSSYNAFASTFSKSREWMRWPEIDHILDTPGFCFEWMRILDVGCGNGRLLNSLGTKIGQFNYLGIDSSSGMIEEAKKLHPTKDFLVCDMLDIDRIPPTPLHKGGEIVQFNRIIFLASFHHLRTESDRVRVLEKAHSLLAPDGIIAMTNWHLLGEILFPKYESMYRWDGDFDIKIGAHSRSYHSFEIDELSDLFKKTGYQIIEHAISETGKNIISLISKK